MQIKLMKKYSCEFRLRFHCLASARCWFLIVFALLSTPIHATITTEHQEAQMNYEKLCGVCHGNSGTGKGLAGASLSPLPTNFAVPGLSASLTAEKLFRAIKNGVQGTSMVGYARKLTDAQIRGLARYIRHEFMQVKSEEVGQPLKPSKVLNSPGKDLYIKHCSACHGDNGNTAVWAKNGLQPPPRDFTAAETVTELTLERMLLSVTHGRPGTAMMSFKGRLSTDEIFTVVNYIRENFMNTGVRSQVNHAPQSLSVTSFARSESENSFYPGDILANRQKGEIFYGQNCFTCHGKSGQGDGPRAHFNRPRPRDFTSVDARQSLSRVALFHAIKKGKVGTVMPAWQTVLSDQEVANIAEFVFTEFVIAPEHSAKKKTLN